MRIRDLITRLQAIEAAHGDVCVLATAGEDVGSFGVTYEADERYVLVDLTEDGGE